MKPASLEQWLAFYSAHLESFKRLNDSQAQARCPFHDDRMPSLSANISTGLWKCHGCGASGNAIEFADKLGIDRKNLPGWEDAVRVAPSPIVAAYNYKDETSALVYQSVRFEPKKFRQRRPDGAGGWIWDLKGIKLILYRLPELLAVMPNESTIYIVEGEKDADTLWDKGFIATTSPMGAGKWRPEYAEVLRGFPEVIVIADKDSAGRNHARQVATSFVGNVDRIKLIELPGENIKDTSDFFTAGKTVKELTDIVAAAPLWLSRATPDAEPELTADAHDVQPSASSEINASSSKGHYVVANGSICVTRFDEHGETHFEPLCNFQAKAVEEVIKDDGVEQKRWISLEGSLANGKPLPLALVPMTEFPSMRWIAGSWGWSAVVRAGQSKQDKLREAIQLLSGPISSRQIYVHTGWKCVKDRWIYIHGKGSIGDAQVEVELDRGLEHYGLPNEVSDAALHGAFERVLKLLEIAEPSITFPLLAAVHLAPFSSLLHVDFVMWLLGTTGSLKSSLAALFLNFFGDFDRTTLPGNWDSTENALERQCFVLKDSLFVIDEFAPSTSSEADREKERKAQRIVRAVGNQAGRDRMKSDLTARPAFRPRGFVISTGEHLPSGQSLTARLFAVPIDRNRINMGALTAAQENQAALPIYMSAFLQTCTASLPEIVKVMKEKFQSYRVSFEAPHLRVPEMTAWLQVGFEAALENLARHFPESITGPLKGRARVVFEALAVQQAATIQDERPSTRYLNVLWTLLIQDKVNLRCADRREQCIGWMDSEFLYIRPGAAHNAVAKFCRDENTYFGVKPSSLHKSLHADGYLVRPTEEDRYAGHEVNPMGLRERVLKLRREKVEELTGRIPEL